MREWTSYDPTLDRNSSHEHREIAACHGLDDPINGTEAFARAGGSFFVEVQGGVVGR
jgi:hypothetical protein